MKIFLPSIFKLFFSAILSLLFLACEHDPIPEIKPYYEAPKELPPITTSGKETLGCRINGFVWVAESETSWPATIAQLDKLNGYSMGIVGYEDIDKKGLIRKIVFRFAPSNTSTDFQLKTYEINKSYGYHKDFRTDRMHSTTGGSGGEVNILRFDSVERIIAGTFWFNAVDTSLNDTIRITDGRFDLNYE